MKIVEIIEGWANVVKDQFDAVDPVTKAVSKKRLLELFTTEMGNSYYYRAKSKWMWL